MNYEELMSIKVIPKDIAKSQSKSLVNNLYHTPYKDEIRLFSCIKQGNLKKLIFEMTQLGIQNITVGQMSDDELKQQKYMAVTGRNTWLQLSVDKLYGILYGKQKRKVLCCVYNK